MSRLPPFIRKNAISAAATATPATTATGERDFSRSSDCSSSSHPSAQNSAPGSVAVVAGAAVASAADQFSSPSSVEAQRWRDVFEERAAIREYDGGLSREDAEAGALDDLVTRWRCEHPLPASDAAACAHCGKRGPDTPVLARGGHAWLHKACWGPMNEARQKEALVAVKVLLGATA